MSEITDYPVILRVLVGSQAHGVADEKSDYDYREVFVVPTVELLQVPPQNRPKDAWESGGKLEDDDGGWEIAKLLHLCLRGHPNALEILCAPIIESEQRGWCKGLRELLPLLASRRAVAESYLGYARNCSKKMIAQEHDRRTRKWAAAYARTLRVGTHFLNSGNLLVSLDADPGIKYQVNAARLGGQRTGEVLDLGKPYEDMLKEWANDSDKPCALREKPDYGAVNRWLMNLRHAAWKGFPE